jgi:hypothetical protein
MNANLMNNAIFLATDSSRLLGSLNELGLGRIIGCRGSLSLVMSADFKAIHPQGRHLPLTEGLLQITPEKFSVLLSFVPCGKGISVSLFDEMNELQLVLHFCSDKKLDIWLLAKIQSGLLVRYEDQRLAPANLCWCELWPDHEKGKTVSSSLTPQIKMNISTIINSRSVKVTLNSTSLELTACIHPSLFDTLDSSIRFWDHPRTRVCYANLGLLTPQIKAHHILLEN